MISFPVTPAPAGPPPGLAGALPATGVDASASALSNGEQFIELLKQLTASANAQMAARPPAALPANASLPIAKADVDVAVAAAPKKDQPPAPPAAAPPAASAGDQALTPPPIVVAPIPVPNVPPPPATPLTASASPAPRKDAGDSAATIAPDADGLPADLPVKQAVDAPAQAKPKFVVATDPQQGGAVNADAAPVASTSPQDAPAAPVSAPHAQAAPQADDANRAGAAKTVAAAPGAPAAPIAVTPVAQNATADASAQKRDANSSSSDRRSLDAAAARASAPAPGSAPVFQIAADVRSVLSGTGGVTLSSPAIAGGSVTVHDAADVPQQIVQAMKLQWNNGVGDARIKLTPDYLGELSISIRVDRGEVTATLQASAPEVRQWIEGHEPMLRQMLAERGLQLDKFVVTDEHPSGPADEDAQGREQQKQRDEQPQGRRRAASGATFEVVV